MLSVLVVDDEAIVRHALRRVLEHDGMTVLEAESGERRFGCSPARPRSMRW